MPSIQFEIFDCYTFDCKFFYQPISGSLYFYRSIFGCHCIPELRKLRDQAPWHDWTRQYCQEEQDQEGYIMDAVDTEAIIFRSDISKYITIEYSHYPDFDIYFKYVSIYYYPDTVVTVWLDFTDLHWSVEASSHHSEDGRKPETSRTQSRSLGMGSTTSRHSQ